MKKNFIFRISKLYNLDSKDCNCYVKTADEAAECGDYDSSFDDIFPDDAGIFISSPNPLFSFICGEQQLMAEVDYLLDEALYMDEELFEDEIFESGTDDGDWVKKAPPDEDKVN